MSYVLMNTPETEEERSSERERKEDGKGKDGEKKEIRKKITIISG